LQNIETLAEDELYKRSYKLEPRINSK